MGYAFTEIYVLAEPPPEVLSGALLPPLLDSSQHAPRLMLAVRRPGDVT